MSSFAALLAQSKARTEAQNAQIQSTLAQREERQRKEQEEREREHQEELTRQAKLRQVQAEAEKRDTERAKQRELEMQAKEQERERKQKAEMDKLLGKKRHELFVEREREANGNSSGNGGTKGGVGSPRKKRSRSTSPSGGSGSGGPVLTRLERRALKTDPNARPAWAISLVGERGGRAGSPPSQPTSQRLISTSKSRKSASAKESRILSGPTRLTNGDGSLSVRERIKSDYNVPIKLSATRRDTGTAADYLEEKRQKRLQEEAALRAENSKTKFSTGGLSSSRAASTGPLPSKSKAPGVKPKSAPSSIAGKKRMRSDSSMDEDGDEDSMFGSSDSDLPRAKRQATGGSILAKYGLAVKTPSRGYGDDDSDLDDMEATYGDVMMEDERTLREAKREDRIALEAEMRHDEEKRKRKMAKAASGRT